MNAKLSKNSPRHTAAVRDRTAADYPTGNSARETILFIGNYRPTIPLISEFHQLGFHVDVGVTDSPELGYAASRLVNERFYHTPHDKNPDLFIDELNDFLAKRQDVAHVMPVAEDMLIFIKENLARFERPDAFTMVLPAVIDLCLNKASILEFAENAGIAQAPFAIVADHAALNREAERIGFPVAIRPTHSVLKFGTRKALLCADGNELNRLLPTWPEGHEKLVIQKRFQGRRHNIYFAARDGKIFRLLETVADRTDHADGTGLAVKGRTIEISPALREETERLVAKLSYTGVGCAQFLVSQTTGDHSFLEINPRIAGNHMLPAKAGLALGPLMLALTKNKSIPGLDSSTMKIAEPGLTYVWTYGDLGGCLREWRNGHISPRAALVWAFTALKDACSADMHMTWSWRDPMPSVQSYGGKLMKSLTSKLPSRHRHAAPGNKGERQ